MTTIIIIIYSNNDNDYNSNNANIGLINRPPPPRKVPESSLNKRPPWLLLMGDMGSWGVPFGSYPNWWFL